MTGDDRFESPDEVFRRARRLTTWHYQWMIVHEFLPLFIGQEMVDDILRRAAGSIGLPWRRSPSSSRAPRTASAIAGAAVLPGELGGRQREPFFGMTFDPAGEGASDPVDLRGGARAPRRFIGWQTFFNFGGIPRPGGQPGTLGEDVRPTN